jgi:hypothetical protein
VKAFNLDSPDVSPVFENDYIGKNAAFSDPLAKYRFEYKSNETINEFEEEGSDTRQVTTNNM